MALKLPDSAVPMGDFPVAKAVDIDFDDGENLQEKLDDGKLGGGNVDLTDIENRLTKLEAIRHYNSIEELGLNSTANINDIITAMNNNTTFTYSSNMFDITEYNNVNYGTVLINKLSSSRVQVLMTDKYTGDLYIGKINNNNQFDGWIKNNKIKNLLIQHQQGNEFYVKITACNNDDISKILFTDSYGGSILITGGIITGYDYKTIKVVRLSNGDWNSYNPSSNTGNKILNVYLGGTDIYIKCGSFTNLYIEGGVDGVETIDSLPTGVTELPILDLTQQTDSTEVNNRLSKLESKRVYNSIEELNSAKGLSIVFTNGEDNTIKIMDALSPTETFADYFDNSSNNSRFGIDTNTYGAGIRCLIITKFNNFNACARAYMSSGKILIRQYANGTLQTGWSYDVGVDLTPINTKLIQLENTVNQVGGGGIYTSGEAEVGKWINGQRLYRTTLAADKSMTITSTSQGEFETLILGNINPSQYRVVKMEGSFKFVVSDSNAKTCVLPCAFADNDMVMNMVHNSRTGDVILQGKKMPVCNITDIYVSIYYYKN